MILRMMPVAILVAALATVVAGRTTNKSTPIVWYTSLLSQTLGIAHTPVEQADWLMAVERQWTFGGTTVAFSMSAGVSVSSCDQAFDAQRRKLHAVGSANDIAAYHARLMACYAARAIGHGTPAKVSYLRGFQMNSRDAHSLPAALSLVISNTDTEEIKTATRLGKTLEDVVEADTAFARRPNPHGDAPMVRVNDGSGGIEDMSLLARGDFNHDGIEDLLISVSSSVVGGTYTQNDLYLVTRLAAGRPMKVLKAYPDLGLGIPTFH